MRLPEPQTGREPVNGGENGEHQPSNCSKTRQTDSKTGNRALHAQLCNGLKLVNTSFMPLSEQKKLHDEIKKLREEINVLERRTRPKG